MERLSIEIPREVGEIVQEAVASSEFASASEMVASAVAEWKSSKLIHGYTVEEFRALVDSASPSSVSSMPRVIGSNSFCVESLY